jgi:transcriptional regulator with XRE-family HTH domain
MQTDISKLFKETRDAYGESQSVFCRRLGCSRVSLSMYETGNFNPGADKYDKLLKLKERLNARGQGRI